MVVWRILRQPISDKAWLILTLSDSACTRTVALMNFRTDLIPLPAHFRLSINLLSPNVIFSLLSSHRIRHPRKRRHYRLKYIPHMWTLVVAHGSWEMMSPDNNGISKWKRLTNSLNVITPGVDLILWALVLLSHWSVPLSHLSVWCQICLKLSQLCRQNESHYNWCISSRKEKLDLSTKEKRHFAS